MSISPIAIPELTIHPKIVEWAFGKRMTPQERLRKHQRALEKTQRELDRERVKLENQEKKLVQDIKKSAKNGQMGACKIQAKDLVRTRRYNFLPEFMSSERILVERLGPGIYCRRPYAKFIYSRYIQKFYSMRTQLQAISLRIQTVRSNEQMMQSMKGATSLLGSMNRSMNLPALQRIAMEFEKENDIMDQRQEMMDDAIDDVTGLEDEEEGEEVVREVLDEIGVDLGQAVCVAFGCASNYADDIGRWERHLRDCRRIRSRRGELQRLLEGDPEREVVVVVELKMMIYKLDWTVYDGDDFQIWTLPGTLYWMLARSSGVQRHA